MGLGAAFVAQEKLLWEHIRFQTISTSTLVIQVHVIQNGTFRAKRHLRHSNSGSLGVLRSGPPRVFVFSALDTSPW